MREKTIEQKLIHAVRARGGIALKLASPSCAGIPDRLVLLPGGRAAFVEAKAPGQKPRPLQARRMEQLRALGFRVYVLDRADGAGEILGDMERGTGTGGRRSGGRLTGHSECQRK